MINDQEIRAPSLALHFGRRTGSCLKNDVKDRSRNLGKSKPSQRPFWGCSYGGGQAFRDIGLMIITSFLKIRMTDQKGGEHPKW